jgi:hypothetical protein
VFFVRPTFSGFCDGVFFPRFNVHFFLFFLLHLIVSIIIRRLFVVRRHLSSRSQIWTFPSLRLRKDILEISQSGGKILSREISFNDERRSVDADDRKWSDHKDRRERRSLNEGDQTAEKADDVIKAARCFFSARRRRNIIWYTD